MTQLGCVLLLIIFLPNSSFKTCDQKEVYAVIYKLIHHFWIYAILFRIRHLQFYSKMHTFNAVEFGNK